MTKRKKTLLILGIALFCILAITGFWLGRQAWITELTLESPLQTPLRASTINGETVLTLDNAAITHSAIETAKLTTTQQSPWLPAFGNVITTQELADARNNYMTAYTQLQRMQAAVEASEKELSRTKTLHQDRQNISDKALQATVASWQTDDANFQAAQSSLQAQKNALYTRWGNTVSDWIMQGGDHFSQLLTQQSTLVQVTLPLGVTGIDTQQPAQLQTDTGALAILNFINTAPTADPRLQGISFFYLTQDKPAGLLPGTTVQVQLPAGTPQNQTVIPASAVVWWQGEAWVYVQLKSKQFVRRQLVTPLATPNGWLVGKGFHANESVVVVGAQTLLSEEFRTLTPATGDGDPDG